METTEVVQFRMCLPKSLLASGSLESVLEALEDLAVTSLSDWQASRAYATLTGKKTMCTPKELIRFVHKGLSFLRHARVRSVCQSFWRLHFKQGFSFSVPVPRFSTVFLGFRTLYSYWVFDFRFHAILILYH